MQSYRQALAAPVLQALLWPSGVAAPTWTSTGFEDCEGQTTDTSGQSCSASCGTFKVDGIKRHNLARHQAAAAAGVP
jgi:hypothetical protein